MPVLGMLRYGSVRAERRTLTMNPKRVGAILVNGSAGFPIVFSLAVMADTFPSDLAEQHDAPGAGQ